MRTALRNSRMEDLYLRATYSNPPKGYPYLVSSMNSPVMLSRLIYMDNSLQALSTQEVLSHRPLLVEPKNAKVENASLLSTDDPDRLRQR